MFAIYLPGRTGANPEHLPSVGLADLLAPDDQAPSYTTLHPGPDGGPGVAVHWGGAIARAADFEWEPAARRAEPHVSPLFWLGRTPGEPLMPADFARRAPHLGREVTLGDGNAWTIATVRQLPRVMGLDSSGAWTGQVDARYKAYYDAAWASLKWFTPDAEGFYSVSYGAGADFVCQALAVNFRANRDVAAWLGLIRTDVFFEVARAATEFDLVLAARQKKTPLSSADGSPTSAAGDTA